MERKIEQERLKLLSAQSAEVYLELLAKSKLLRGYKGSITKEWLKKKGMSIQELSFYKRQHPFWKRQKTKGALERQLERQKQYNFKKTEEIRMDWNEKKLQKFLELHPKLADWELAREFKTSLPSVNHIRRKIKYATAILGKTGRKIRQEDLIFHIARSERLLKKELLEGNNGSMKLSLNGAKRKN